MLVFSLLVNGNVSETMQEVRARGMIGRVIQYFPNSNQTGVEITSRLLHISKWHSESEIHPDKPGALLEIVGYHVGTPTAEQNFA